MMELLRQLNEAKLNRHVMFDDLDISVEVPADGYRRGVNKKTGESWSIKVPAHYGYIKGTHSPDGEHLDCYLRKNPDRGAKVYVIHQLTVDGSRFDEDKVMLGYPSKPEAIRAFKSVTFKPSAMFGGCTEFTMEHFQVIAFSSSNSHTMLTDRSTYHDFKKRGLLDRGIKSPIAVARKISEDLQRGLEDIGEQLIKGDLLECLEWAGDVNGDVDAMVHQAWNHYQENPQMVESHHFSEEQFKDMALNYIMETDALMTDTKDEILEDQNLDVPEIIETIENPDIIEQIDEDVMTDNNFVVVIYTQIMENIGTSDLPQWATAGSKTQLVREGLGTWGEARAVAARVSSGEIPVSLDEGAYVLGIDVMPVGEFRQFHESSDEELDYEVKEDVTDDVFFAQQIQETQRLAGVTNSPINETQGTPSVHETRARLESLTQEFYEGLENEILEEDDDFPVEKLAEAMNLIQATKLKNPQASTNMVAKAICKKVYGNVNLAESLLDQALMIQPDL